MTTIPSEAAITAARLAPFCPRHTHHEWNAESDDYRVPSELEVWRERAGAATCPECLRIRLYAAYAAEARIGALNAASKFQD